MEGLKGDNEDETTGIEIIKRAIEEPLRQIVANAGKEGAVVVQKVREGKGDFGYNARTDVYENLHAAGVARAMVYYGHKGVVITSHGESASSEGFVYEAVNGASLERLPVIFVWQDNGYGISVPKKDQTAARKVADNFSGSRT